MTFKKLHLTQLLIFTLVGFAAIIVSRLKWYCFLVGLTILILTDWFIVPIHRRRIIEEYLEIVKKKERVIDKEEKKGCGKILEKYHYGTLNCGDFDGEVLCNECIGRNWDKNKLEKKK